MAEWPESRQIASQYHSPGPTGIGFAVFASTGTVTPELWDNIRYCEAHSSESYAEGWAEDMAKLRRLLEEDGIRDVTCEECSEEDGPCENHSELMISREGASLRTADDLALIFLQDCLSLKVETTPWGKDVIARAEAALSANESMGVRWLPEGAEGEAIRDDMATLQWQLESELSELGFSVYREDGYRIVKITGGPLAEGN